MDDASDFDFVTAFTEQKEAFIPAGKWNSVNTKYPFPFTKNKGQLKNQMRSLNSRINRALTDNQPKNVLSRKDLQCMT